MKHGMVGLFLGLYIALPACAGLPRGSSDIDLIHALYRVALFDSTDCIEASAVLTVAFRKEGIQEFRIDLVSRSAGAGSGMNISEAMDADSIGRGMNVFDVREDGVTSSFSHSGDVLLVRPKTSPKAGEIRTYAIRYHGIPDSGLVIRKNRFGDRSFFGDSWPRGLRHWLPCVDHPSDKYTCEFDIEAPSQYQVVANGRMVEETNLSGGRTLTRWTSSVPLASKVMTVGVARFAVEHLESVRRIPVQTWVFPQNREEGFQDFTPASGIVDFFDRMVGPYPFEKLANVQAVTIWGGFESAGAILYNQNAITGNGKLDGLLAHEIAHQWFGDAVTEADWSEIWLSEGFATYLEALWIEATSCPDTFRQTMARARDAVASFATEHPESPVIDTAAANPTALLNANSYEKGAWVLHMLRNLVGDSLFLKGIRYTYSEYRYKNMSTDQFRAVMESVSGMDLGWFFRQWLKEPGIPELFTSWSFDAKTGNIEFSVKQVQEGGRIFRIPLEVEIRFRPPAAPKRFVLDMRESTGTFRKRIMREPVDLVLDPDVRTLFAMTRKEKDRKGIQ